jgi:hypothetical protein
VADTSIVNLDPGSTDRARYVLGRGNWAPPAQNGRPWVPDLTNPSAAVRLTGDQVIDVLILGDGYTDQGEFEAHLADWLDDFYAVEVYDRFRGAFRVRALFTRSDERCSAVRRSYYRVAINSSGGVSGNNWWNAGTSNGRLFRRRLFDAAEAFDANGRRYPSSLDVSAGGLVIHNELARLYSHLVVVMLVWAQGDSGPYSASGRTRRVKRRSSYVNVAFGAYSLHEFGHAFAYLEDEYIDGRGSRARRRNPRDPSLFTLSNIAFSDRLASALWTHLSPWGSAPRQAAGEEPSPTVGWLWRGGEHDRRVWHAEYHCLMNGSHDNYAYTSTQAQDPTAGPDGRYHGDGANLRWRHPPRFCLWCQEIVAARILEKTGQLAAPGDPSGINARGRVWYERWVAQWRRLYWTFFDVTRQIRERESLYANPALEPGSFTDIRRPDGTYLPVWRSDLYKPFRAAPGGGTASPDAGDDEELVMLNA